MNEFGLSGQVIWEAVCQLIGVVGIIGICETVHCLELSRQTIYELAYILKWTDNKFRGRWSRP